MSLCPNQVAAASVSNDNKAEPRLGRSFGRVTLRIQAETVACFAHAIPGGSLLETPFSIGVVESRTLLLSG
jgi:hypothetical protein